MEWPRSAAPDLMRRRLCGIILRKVEACLMTARWMVGTDEYHVGRLGTGPATRASQKVSGRKDGRQTTDPPVASGARMDADRPPM